jgi:hypothetical protein
MQISSLIQQCLHNLPAKRPDIREVLHLLDEARACVRDDDCEMNKRELVHALQAQPMNQNYERVLRDLVKQNADLKSRVQAKDKDLAKAQQQLRQKEEELQSNLLRSLLRDPLKPLPACRKSQSQPMPKPRRVIHVVAFVNVHTVCAIKRFPFPFIPFVQSVRCSFTRDDGCV